MPFESKKQRGFLFAKKPKVAEEFAEKTSAKEEKELPEYASRKKKQVQALKKMIK
jgi:inorganic pyrophosphatase/exopolyphosphatase